MRVWLDEYGIMPTKNFKSDAGMDIPSPVSFPLNGGEIKTIKTGIHMAIPNGYCGFIKPRSGLLVKHSIFTSGVIDSGYHGEIAVTLFNAGKTPCYFVRGERIAQIVIIPFYNPEIFPGKEGERGNAGFGSSGR